MPRKIKEQAGYKSVDNKPGFVLSKTSLDAQVKSYLQRFEEEAVALTENFYGARFKDQALFESVSALFEQEEEDDILGDLFGDEEGVEADETEQPGSEQPSDQQMGAEVEASAEPEPEGDMGGSNDMGGELPVEVPDVNPKIDVQGFGQNVLSLIETAQHKLDFENAIMNLAIRHLKEQYGVDMSKKLVNFFEGMGYNFVIQDDNDIPSENKEV